MSPEIEPSATTEQYTNIFPSEFHPHALLHQKLIMIEVILCSAIQCRELGVSLEQRFRSPRTMWKVAVGMNEQRQICFSHIIPENIGEKMKQHKRESWPEAKRRVTLKHLITSGELEAIDGI